MKLKNLFKNYQFNKKYENIEITGITSHSKQVKAGYIFFAIKGYTSNGYNFINEAIHKKAKVIVSNKDFKHKFNGVKIIANNPYNESITIANKFYKYPGKKLNLIGVTGTNGKTTITHILDSIYKANSEAIGTIGTIYYKIKNKTYEATNTTPCAIELQRILRQMLNSKIKTVVMEVSSHALSLNRTKECNFNVAIFTNLTQDHLDFHGNMNKYFLAKKKLFDGLTQTSKKFAILNMDDSRFNRLVKSIKVPIISYGLNKNANIRATNIQYKMKETEFDLTINNKQRVKIKTSLIGQYNVSNVLASIATAVTQNIPIKNIQKGLKKIFVPGRFEIVHVPGQKFICILDYAHTHDALKRLIQTARNLKPNKIITIFGCGGDRDRGKRPIMGKIATQNSDFTIITSDNPRTEKITQIMNDIKKGVTKNYKIIIDRYKAIQAGLKLAKPNDIVLIAGKGHENYQIIGTTKKHFSDRNTARCILKKIVKVKS